MFKTYLIPYMFNQSKRLCTRANILSISNVYERKCYGENIKIQGWIKAVRKMKSGLFVDINDGSCSNDLQVVIVSQSEKPKGLSSGAAVIASGVLSQSPKGQVELNADNIEVCGACTVTDGYPLAPKKSYTAEYTRQYLHFRPRMNKFASLLRVRDYTALSVHNYFHEEGYIHINTPILTSNDCEGAGEAFTVLPANENTLKGMAKSGVPSDKAYFDSKAFLTVSGQLHLEAAAHSLGKVYTLGPTFRAENSKSRLHLSEFYMLEAECAFVDRIEQVLEIIEKLIKTVSHKVLNKCEGDIEKCREEKLDFNWINQPFVVLTYDEAIRILQNNKGKYKGDVIDGRALAKDHEHFLVQYSNGVPTFIINWPKAIKPFYMKDCSHDVSKVAAVDLLVPNVGELVGGSVRENIYDVLKTKLPSGQAELDWYLDIRKFGSVSTGGFGLGFERYLQLLLGISNIKDTIPFPRWPHNCQL